MVTVADVKSLKFQVQCALLQSLEFKKHMAETRGEHYAPVTAAVLHSIFHVLKNHIPELNQRYALQYEIQAAALLLWKRYKNADPKSLYPEISVCESVLSYQEVPPMIPWQHIGSEAWEDALNKTFDKFEGMPAEEVFARAREHQEKGESFIPSAFVHTMIAEQGSEKCLTPIGNRRT